MYWSSIFIEFLFLNFLRSPVKICAFYACFIADSIVKYMKSLVRPLSTELNSVDDVEHFRDHPDHSVVGMSDIFMPKDSNFRCQVL